MKKNIICCHFKASQSEYDIQSSSVTQSYPTLCNPMDWGTPGFPVHHQILKLAQTNVHRVGDATQPSNPLSSLSPPAFNPSHHQGLLNDSVIHIRWKSIGVSASALVLLKNVQHWSPLGWTGWISLHSKGLSRVFSNTTLQKYQFFCTQLSLWSNTHIHTWLLEKSGGWNGNPLQYSCLENPMHWSSW